MKHLYLFAFAMLTVIGLNQSSAQNIIKTNASGVGICDGTAFNTFHDWWSDSGWTWSWYRDSIQIAGADSIITNLCTGNYSMVANSMGVPFYVETFTITDPCSDFVHNVYYTNSIPDSCTGLISSYSFGGHPPYAYSWSTGDSTAFIENLCPGDYTITATDSLGCIQTRTITIEYEYLNATLWIDSGYYANCSGQASITPYGGTPPYSILWNTGDTTDHIQYLCDGTYSVTVVDATNDSLNYSFTIQVQEPRPLAADSWIYDDYDSTCSGQASVNPTGGTKPYSIHWSTGDSSYYAYNLCTGTYYATIVDALNDSITITINVGPIPEPLAADFWSHDNSYFYNSPQCSGIAYVRPRGGTPPYSILWDTYDTTEDVGYLCIGNHSVTVVDAANDSLYFTFTIQKPFATTYWTSNNANDCNGAAAVYPYGGTPPYSIHWNTGDTTEFIDSLCPGTYTAYVTDATNTDTMFTAFTLTDSSVIYGRDNSPSISDLSVSENPLESVSIYPNPFTDVIKIDNQNGAVQSMKLTDLNGRIIGERTDLNSGVIDFDGLESIGSGTYFLILSGEKHSKTYKLIK
ncbi:T9SS type A sorting domain-containing protein [Fluviicola sp.]|uniref:T9SS type A sorting domain-containing protein n=1 Tax=Fluviicola sp. TaxID=1917219 RepID=UPI00261BD657|nr:T9SS type A sorting domain-containing protein [Fluviicola sp.]